MVAPKHTELEHTELEHIQPESTTYFRDLITSL